MNRIVVLLLVFTTMTRLSAQLDISVCGGVNLSKPVLKPTYEFADFRSDFFIGVSNNYQLSRRFFIDFTAQYSAKAYNLRQNLFTEAIRNTYIDVLPSVEFRPLPFLGVIAGVNAAGRIDQKFLSNGQWARVPNSFTEKFDLGYLVGLKAYLGDFYLRIHYNEGLLPMESYELTDDSGNEKSVRQFQKNIQVGLGYVLPL